MLHLNITLKFLDSEEPDRSKMVGATRCVVLDGADIWVLRLAEKILRLTQYCTALRIKPKADGVTLGQLLEV